MKNLFQYILALMFIGFMSACGAECADCQSNGAAGINDLGLVCPADFESNDAYDDFIRQYEVSGGDCN